MWKKEIPKKDGWYWISYVGKHGRCVCPCTVTHFRKELKGVVIVSTARNSTFTNETRKMFGFNSARFYSRRISEPQYQ